MISRIHRAVVDPPDLASAGLVESQSSPYPLSPQAVDAGSSSVAREVDETALDIGVDQFDLNVVAHVKTPEPAFQSPFRRRLENPNPRSLRGGAGDDRIEGLPHPAGQEQRGRRLADPPLDFG